MTTYNLNIANISFNSSLDSRDIQEEIDNIEIFKNFLCGLALNDRMCRGAYKWIWFTTWWSLPHHRL